MKKSVSIAASAATSPIQIFLISPVFFLLQDFHSRYSRSSRCPDGYRPRPWARRVDHMARRSARIAADALEVYESVEDAGEETILGPFSFPALDILNPNSISGSV